ncbi:MAG: DUF6164 family protein [Dokdonella sp.]
MPTLLLNLRHVPDDEADDVRALLEEHAIAYYETAPNRWGISAGAIWIADDGRPEEAKRVLADYQEQRSDRARREFSDARRDGTAPSVWSTLREDPVRVVVVLISIACVVALSLWPFLLSG